MATAFNLTAQINLRGPSNVRNIVSDIRRQLGTVTGDVNLRINPSTTRNITSLNSALTTLNNNLSATTNNANNAANAIRQFGSAISSIGNGAAALNRNLNNTAAAANNTATGMTNTARQTRAASSEMIEFGRTAGLAIRRFTAFSLSAGTIMGLTNAIRKGIDAFIEYDRQFVKLQQVTGESASGLSQLAKTISGLSTSLGVSSNELTDVSLTLAQAGLTARDTERALKALALSSLAPSFDNMNQTVEGSIALMRQFGISANDLEKSLGAVNAVSAKFAVEASDIIAAIQRTGGVFASASRGVSEGTDALNEFIAVFTSVRATTRESAETIATGLRTIFTRIQRGGTIEALKEFGVNLTDAEGKFVGAYKAVQLLSEGLNSIDPRDLKFSEIVEELGGFRQIGKVIPLIQQFATAQDALRVAQQGQGSLAADAAKAQASLANQAAKVREEFLALFREIGGSDTFQALAKGALSLASALISVADSVKGVLPVLAIMTAFRGASSIRQFGTGFLRGLRPGGAKSGGYIKYAAGGGVGVPVALMPGEAVIYPEEAARIGTSTLKKMNYADKRQRKAAGGKIGIVPGQGNSDSFYTTLPEGSFVIRKAATQTIGPSNIADIASGRKKFAQGGLAQLKSSTPYVRNIDSTYDKKSGESIEKAIKRRENPPLRFNLKDTIEANIKRQKVVLTEEQIERARTINPKVTEMYIGNRGATGSKGSSARGTGFERILDVLGYYKQEKGNKFSRVDGVSISGNTPVEVKSKDAQVSTRDLLDKVIGSVLFERSNSEKIIADKARPAALDKNPNNINIGDLIVMEDATPGLLKNKKTRQPVEYRSQEEIEKTERSLLYRPKRTRNISSNYRQQLMAGEFVKPRKSRAGRKTRQILADITESDAEKLPASKIIGELTALGVEDILRSAGVDLTANELLRKRNPNPMEANAQRLVIRKYVEKINKKASENREGNQQATQAAASIGTLFGAVGMFGNPFPPEELVLSAGLREPVTVRVFGAVLDKNKAARAARLKSLQLNDPNYIDIKNAPIASKLDKEYTREELSGVRKRNNERLTKSILEALSGGSGTKAFFDFDKTLALKTDPIGYKAKKGTKPDYTAFGDLDLVTRGLQKAKPSILMSGLVRLVNKTRKRMPDQLSSLLSNMYVVSARPQNTMGAIASWLASKGLPIPAGNVRGVGGSGMSDKAVGVAKANTILEAAGSSSSVFVDDAAENIMAAKASNIKSYTYGLTFDKDRASKKAIADSQGAKFQNEISSYLKETAPQLYGAMAQEAEIHRSVDFPYGLGATIARNWFNNSLLANIPVDAKRTLTGPRGKIPSNITNYLKARGFAFGGAVQKLSEGGAPESGPELITHGGSKYLKDDVVKAMREVTGKTLTPEEAIAEFTKRNAKGDLFYTDWGIPSESQKLPKSLRPYTGPAGLLEKVQGSIMQKQDRIATWKQRQGLGSSDYEGRTTEQKKYLRARGRYAAGGEIPIMAQEGEYVINRHSAQAIGYSNLHKLNKYHNGGVVQKFARGTTVRPLEPGQYIRSGMTYDIRAGEADALQQREDKIRARIRRRQQQRQQTAEATPQARTLRRNIRQERDDRIQAIQKKYATDTIDIDQRILRIKQAALKQYGVNLTDAQVTNQLMKMSLKSDKEIAQAKKTAVMQYKQGLKTIMTDVSGPSSRYNPKRRAGGNQTGRDYYDSIYSSDKRRDRQEEIQRIRQNRLGGIGGAIRSTGLRARNLVSNVLPDTLKNIGVMPFSSQEQARNAQTTANSRIAPVAAGRRASASMRDLTQSDSFRALDPAARKQALIDAGFGRGGAGSQAILAGNAANRRRNNGGLVGGRAVAAGSSGDRQNSAMNRAFMLSMAIPMIGDLFAGGEAKTASQARSQSLTQGATTAIGSSVMMGSMVSEMTQGMGGIAKFAGPVAMVTTAVIGLTKAFIDAENAAREFAISSEQKKLETSIEITNNSLQKFSENLKDRSVKETARTQVLQTIGQTENVITAKNKPQLGFANLFDYGENVDKRSEVLFSKGVGSYIQTLEDPISNMFGMSNKNSLGYSSSDIGLSRQYSTLIPQKSRDRAADFRGAAEATQQFLTSNIKSGTSISDLETENKPQFDSFIRSLALADASVQEQIMNIENSTNIQKEQKSAMIAGIIAANGERKAREIQTKILKEKSLEELNRSANHLQNSLERMFQNMEQAIGRNVFQLNNLSQQAELSASALSGNAKAGQVALKSMNVLQNPRAYNKTERASAAQNAANMFGSESATMKGLLQAGGAIEDTIMSTINKTIKEDPTAGNEKIGIRIQSNISKALEDLKIPPDLSAKLSKQVNEAIGQIRQKGDEKIDFGDLMEKVPQLGKVMDATRRAQEAALKALEHWQNGLNDYANSMNQMVDLQVEANSRMRRASDIQIRGQMELDKVLGKEISLRDQMNVATAGVRSQTGGITDPAAIAQNIRRLEDRRATQQSMSNTAGQRGFGGADEFKLMQDRLRNTNIALRENYDALKSMADNTEMASIAMAKINEIQQKRQAGVNMAERLVTSSPQEFSQLNRAMDRLNNNMQGGINFGSSAEQRKESLDAFNMIAPFLGEKQNEMKANVLESMLMESGVGVNSMMAEVLQSLRNPEGDPEMQAAIAEYKKAVDLQALANKELGLLNLAIAKNTEETAATKLASVMSTFKFTFEGAQLNDVVNEIKLLRQVVENKPGAMGADGFSSGGIIYAAAGQLVNFQPKGTDTVPAMLTPGEFVVNRSATQKHLPLLNKINSGGYSSGGRVKYYADGGYVAVDEKWSNIADEKEREDKAERDYEQTSRTNKSIKLDNINWKYINANDITKEKFYFFDNIGYALSSRSQEDLLSSDELYENKDINRPKNINRLITGKSLFWGLGTGVDEIQSTSNNSVPLKFQSKHKLSRKFTELPSRKWIDDATNQTTSLSIEEGSAILNDIIEKTNKISEMLPFIDKNNGELITARKNKIIYDLNKIKPNQASPSFSVSTKNTKTSLIRNADGTISPGKEEKLKNNQVTWVIKNLTQSASNISDGALLLPSEVNDLFKANAGNSNTVTFDAGEYIGGGNYLPKIAAKPLRNQNFATEIVSDDLGDSMSYLSDYLNKIFILQENLTTTHSILKDKKSFKETEESLKNKERISNFQNLFNNTIPSAPFNKTIEGYQSPLTLYNENISKKWSDYSGRISALKAQKSFNFSETGDDFIKLKDLANNNIKSFAWTDAGFTPEDYNSVFGNIQDNIELVKKNVNSKIEEYNKDGLQFTYRRYLAPSLKFNMGSRRYTDEPISPRYAFIEPQSPDISPVNPFAGGIIPQGSVIWTTDLNNSLTKILSGEQTNFKTTQFLDPSSYPNVEPFTLSNEDHPEVPYDFSKFLEARQKNLDKIEKEKAISAVKSDFSMDELAKVNDAKRITLARAFYKLAKTSSPKNVQEALQKDITTIADIGNTAIAISSKIPANAPSDSYARHSIDAWRAAFAEIYNNKDAKLLQNLGVNMADDAFSEPLIEKSTLGNNVIRYYKNYTGASPELLQSIINREIMIKTGSMTSTAYEQPVDEKGNPLGVAKGDSYAFGASGQAKVEKDVTPDSWNKVRELALDPQRVFPDIGTRSNLFDQLISFYTSGKNKYGESIIPTDALREEKIDRLESLQWYFHQFDRLVNTGMATGEPNDTELGRSDNWVEALDYKFLATSLKAMKSDEGSKNWNEFSQSYKPLLNLENGRDTLTANQVAQIIIATGALKEEQTKKAEEAAQQTATMSNGGVVYASKGALVNYQPRGTDTVPAMLTPGEFVVNRAATQKHLPVLKAINEGHYSRGGIVKYLSGGGIIFPNYYETAGITSANNSSFNLSSFMGDIFGQITSAITTGFQNASSAIGGGLTTTTTNGVSSIDTDTLNKIGEFTNRLKSVADTLAGLSAIPQEITITVTHTHNVIINGDSALNKLSPDLQDIAMDSIREKFAELTALNQTAGAPLINPFDQA